MGFVGLVLPFPENPFYRWAHDVVIRQMAAEGITPQGEFSRQFLPGEVQTAVFKFMASAIELMPVYNFVEDKGRPVPFPETYAGLVHTGTGERVIEIIRRFRQHMVQERKLDNWLRVHGLEYHFLAATGFPTIMGYERSAKRIVTEPNGDGSVPIGSGRVLPNSTHHLHVATLTGEKGLSHPRLCERRDVQNYCLSVLGRRRPAPRVTGMREPQAEDFVAMAKEILKGKPRHRGIVLSIARLEAPEGPPLVDTTSVPSDNPNRRRLKNPPNRVSSRDIFEVQSPRHGKFQYVFVHAHKDAGYPVGGVLFLPTPAERHVFLVTWNCGPLDTRYVAQCKNEHHAEIQLTEFVDSQPKDWRLQVRTLRIDNRSRSASVPGYSPCNWCCDDLAKFLTALKALPGSRGIDATLCWLKPYTKAPICGHPTNEEGLGMLRQAGWKLPRPLPSANGAARPAAVPVELTRAIAAGNRNPTQLTDLVFFARHPERGGRKIALPAERAAADEWIALRDRIVLPQLRRISRPRPTRQSGGSRTPAGRQ